ncbi:hypothetical protein EDC01DRAFT_120955 [Geopyxis carbonaria]|nr:hypothetical protein EDC01DRAFT_120955 [Geopyxis carbonaria]
MFLLNKVTTSRRNSRELTPEERTEINEHNMDYMYSSTGPDFNKPKARRQRSRTSFFDFGGSKRNSREYISDDITELSSRSSSRLTLHEKSSISSLSPRRRLRKVSSKASLASFVSQSPVSEKSKSIARPKASISQPFNFTHLTHHNPRDASQIRYGDPRTVGEEWNRALVRESQSRPLTAHPSMQSIESFHSRNESVTTVGSLGSRARSASTKSISPSESFSDLSAPPPPREPLQLQQQYACPITPPLRASSRHCLRILEHPEEEEKEDDETLIIENNDDVSEDVILVGRVEVGQAVTTEGDRSYGRKSVGLETLLVNPVMGPRIEGTEFPSPPTPTENENMPAIRETRSSPDLSQSAKDFVAERRQQALLTVRQRPLSQLSQLSDTLNGNFTIPQSPMNRYGSVRSRRMSRRMSTHLRLHGDLTSDDPTGLDCWDEDIDWCYEHEAEADCDFDWDRGSTYSASEYSEHPSAQSTRAPSPILFHEPLKSDLTQIPEQQYDDEETVVVEPVRNRFVERRITGIFEDRLLLPPSPSFPPSPRFPPNNSLWGLPQAKFDEPIRARDSGFESGTTDDLSVRTDSSSTRQRSLSSSPPVPDLVPERYREELSWVASQLDTHIAALNKECYYPLAPPPSLPKRPSLPEIIQQITGNRARANSEATCVTLCSDTDTITPTEANEAVTPSSSAHSSFNFTKPRASSVVGGGLAVEGRIEKGLSFPAAAIPGVVEIGPDCIHEMYGPEDEFVPFI